MNILSNIDVKIEEFQRYSDRKPTAIYLGHEEMHEFKEVARGCCFFRDKENVMEYMGIPILHVIADHHLNVG